MLHETRVRLSLTLVVLWITAVSAAAQTATVGAGEPTQASGAPLTLTLQDALERARANSPQLHTALTELGLAREDRVQARAGLLPGVTYTSQYLYTEGNGTPTGRFIANNAVHEYLAQGNAHQAFSLAQVADFRRTRAAEALARARTEIAARGLGVTVVQSYYGLVVAERKYSTTQQATQEAQRFLKITQDLERGGEVAHSDVIKAQLQYNDRARDLNEAQLAMASARAALAVLLFPDFNQNFTVVDDLAQAKPLPPLGEVQQLAERNNPDLGQALAALKVAGEEVSIARSGHLPSLTFDYWYGIDADHFATRTGPIRNLGYSAAATLSLPIFSWGATQSKVKQASLRRQQARVELSATQRQLVANLQTFYAEAETARAERDTLRNSADLAAEGLRLTTLRYQAGEVSVLEVVDAQNSLTLARNAYDDGEARYRLALANLQTLTGSF